MSRGARATRTPTCCTATAPRAAPMRGCAAAAPSASTRRTAAACTTAARSPVGLLYLTLEQVLMRAHRPVPVREPLRPRRVRRQDRHAARARARRAQRRHGGGIRRRSRRRPTRPTSCSSASCACSRASTCCSTRSRCLRARPPRDRDHRRRRARMPEQFRAQAERLGLGSSIRFLGADAGARRPSRSGACWSRPRAPNPCPTSSSKPPPPASR